MPVNAISGITLGAALAASVTVLVAALRGWTPARRSLTSRARSRPSADVARTWMTGRRWLIAPASAVVVMIATRWPVAGLAAGAVVILWPRIFGAGGDAATQIKRIEALATWTESLRDSIAGSIGLDEAIAHSVGSAPAVLRGPLQRLEGRQRAQMPLTDALTEFADDLDDSSADLVVAALILNATLRGPGLVATLSALSLAAREEVDMRRKIEEGRKALRRTAAVIITVTGLFAGGLAVLSRDYVAPYSTGIGQVVLAVVLSVFAGGLVWIRSAADLAPPPRFLARTPHSPSSNGLQATPPENIPGVPR